MNFDRYEEVPAHIGDKVIDKHKEDEEG